MRSVLRKQQYDTLHQSSSHTCNTLTQKFQCWCSFAIKLLSKKVLSTHWFSCHICSIKNIKKKTKLFPYGFSSVHVCSHFHLFFFTSAWLSFLGKCGVFVFLLLFLINDFSDNSTSLVATTHHFVLIDWSDCLYCLLSVFSPIRLTPARPAQ